MFIATDVISENVDELNNEVSRLSTFIDNSIDKLVNFAFDLVTAVIILLIGKVILKLLRKFIKGIFVKSGVDEGVTKFLDSLINAIGYFIIIIVICGHIGIQTTSLITLLGTAGLSVGLALEGCLSNFAGGVLILVTKPFRIDDYIIANGIEGTVQKIDIIYTTLNTIDNKMIKVPNGTLSNSVLINATYNEKRRVDVEVGIHYEDDVKEAKKIARAAMDGCKYALKDEDNVVVLKNLGESSVVLEIRMWVWAKDYWDAKFYLNERIKKDYEENEITIPYNQIDVHIKESK